MLQLTTASAKTNLIENFAIRPFLFFIIFLRDGLTGPQVAMLTFLWMALATRALPTD